MSAPKPRAAASRHRTSVEDGLLRRLASVLMDGARPPAAGELSIGDDAAVVAAPAGYLVLSVDTAVAGVHADLSLTGLDDLGFKALTAAVSDLAAMGADPGQALVALSVPPGPSAPGTVVALGDGLAEASRTWHCPVVGGDLTTAPEVVVSVTVVGHVPHTVGSRGGPLTRSGAEAGDVLFVTGPLGAAAAGLRILRAIRDGRTPAALDEHAAAAVRAHRRPAARLAEGRAARLAGASAALDVSDGLGLDLHRLSAASGVGVALDAVPVAPGASWEEALGGGDDYELVVATPDPDGLRRAFADAGLREPIEIGRCVEDPTRRTVAGEPLEATGWQFDVGP